MVLKEKCDSSKSPLCLTWNPSDGPYNSIVNHLDNYNKYILVKIYPFLRQNTSEASHDFKFQFRVSKKSEWVPENKDHMSVLDTSGKFDTGEFD